MAFFKNFFVVFILIGGITRLSNFLFQKYIEDKKIVIYVSSISTGLIICFIAAMVLGFDVVISEYLISFIIWFIFDLLKTGMTKKED